MRTIYILAVVLLLAACSKEAVHNRAANRVDFFADDRDALCKIQRYTDSFGRKEVINRILSVSYIDSERKSYAFVFYESDRGAGNMVIEQQYDGDAVVLSKSIKCEGESCSCKVKSVIGDNGDITLDCSCTSCTMLIQG